MGITAAQWLTILSGGLAGAFFGLAANSWLGCWRRAQLHRKLEFERPALHQGTLTLRVRNGYVLPLTSCWAYLTLEFDPSNIVNPPADRSAHIDVNRPLSIREDRLCWSVNPDNPPKVDIYAGESQSLQVLELDPDGKWVGILSETRNNPYRVFLKGGKVYEGTLKIVCREIKSKEIAIRIDLQDPNFPKNLLKAE
jgi:hypothetical protein